MDKKNEIIANSDMKFTHNITHHSYNPSPDSAMKRTSDRTSEVNIYKPESKIKSKICYDFNIQKFIKIRFTCIII